MAQLGGNRLGLSFYNGEGGLYGGSFLSDPIRYSNTIGTTQKPGTFTYRVQGARLYCCRSYAENPEKFSLSSLATVSGEGDAVSVDGPNDVPLFEIELYPGEEARVLLDVTDTSSWRIDCHEPETGDLLLSFPVIDVEPGNGALTVIDDPALTGNERVRIRIVRTAGTGALINPAYAHLPGSVRLAYRLSHDADDDIWFQEEYASFEAIFTPDDLLDKVNALAQANDLQHDNAPFEFVFKSASFEDVYRMQFAVEITSTEDGYAPVVLSVVSEVEEEQCVRPHGKWRMVIDFGRTVDVYGAMVFYTDPRPASDRDEIKMNLYMSASDVEGGYVRAFPQGKISLLEEGQLRNVEYYFGAFMMKNVGYTVGPEGGFWASPVLQPDKTEWLSLNFRCYCRDYDPWMSDDKIIVKELPSQISVDVINPLANPFDLSAEDIIARNIGGIITKEGNFTIPLSSIPATQEAIRIMIRMSRTKSSAPVVYIPVTPKWKMSWSDTIHYGPGSENVAWLWAVPEATTPNHQYLLSDGVEVSPDKMDFDVPNWATSPRFQILVDPEFAEEYTSSDFSVFWDPAYESEEKLPDGYGHYNQKICVQYSATDKFKPRKAYVSGVCTDLAPRYTQFPIPSGFSPSLRKDREYGYFLKNGFTDLDANDHVKISWYSKELEILGSNALGDKILIDPTSIIENSIEPYIIAYFGDGHYLIFAMGAGDNVYARVFHFTGTTPTMDTDALLVPHTGSETLLIEGNSLNYWTVDGRYQCVAIIYNPGTLLVWDREEGTLSLSPWDVMIMPGEYCVLSDGRRVVLSKTSSNGQDAYVYSADNAPELEIEGFFEYHENVNEGGFRVIAHVEGSKVLYCWDNSLQNNPPYEALGFSLIDITSTGIEELDFVKIPLRDEDEYFISNLDMGTLIHAGGRVPSLFRGDDGTSLCFVYLKYSDDTVMTLPVARIITVANDEITVGDEMALGPAIDGNMEVSIKVLAIQGSDGTFSGILMRNIYDYVEDKMTADYLEFIVKNGNSPVISNIDGTEIGDNLLSSGLYKNGEYIIFQDREKMYFRKVTLSMNTMPEDRSIDPGSKIRVSIVKSQEGSLVPWTSEEKIHDGIINLGGNPSNYVARETDLPEVPSDVHFNGASPYGIMYEAEIIPGSVYRDGVLSPDIEVRRVDLGAKAIYDSMKRIFELGVPMLRGAGYTDALPRLTNVSVDRAYDKEGNDFPGYLVRERRLADYDDSYSEYVFGQNNEYAYSINWENAILSNDNYPKEGEIYYVDLVYLEPSAMTFEFSSGYKEYALTKQLVNSNPFTWSGKCSPETDYQSVPIIPERMETGEYKVVDSGGVTRTLTLDPTVDHETVKLTLSANSGYAKVRLDEKNRVCASSKHLNQDRFFNPTVSSGPMYLKDGRYYLYSRPKKETFSGLNAVDGVLTVEIEDVDLKAPISVTSPGAHYQTHFSDGARNVPYISGTKTLETSDFQDGKLYIRLDVEDFLQGLPQIEEWYAGAFAVDGVVCNDIVITEDGFVSSETTTDASVGNTLLWSIRPGHSFCVNPVTEGQSLLEAALYGTEVDGNRIELQVVLGDDAASKTVEVVYESTLGKSYAKDDIIPQQVNTNPLLSTTQAGFVYAYNPSDSPICQDIDTNITPDGLLVGGGDDRVLIVLDCYDSNGARTPDVDLVLSDPKYGKITLYRSPSELAADSPPLMDESISGRFIYEYVLTRKTLSLIDRGAIPELDYEEQTLEGIFDRSYGRVFDRVLVTDTRSGTVRGINIPLYGDIFVTIDNP